MHPDECEDSPEKAIQQIDPAMKIERKMRVIPRNGTDDLFLHNAAHIFVHAAKHCPTGENPEIPCLAERVEYDGHHHRAEAVHEIKRSDHQSLAAFDFVIAEHTPQSLDHNT